MDITDIPAPIVPARQRTTPGTCLICFEDKPKGVRCDSDHFTCADCLGELVQHKSDDLAATDNLAVEATAASDPAEAKKLAGFIFCPCRGAGGCESDEPFAEAAIAKLFATERKEELPLEMVRAAAALPETDLEGLLKKMDDENKLLVRQGAVYLI